jgi:hypothetical protein
MTRPEGVRFLRTEATMAFPQGRLLAHRGNRVHVLAPDGWTSAGVTRPPNATWLTREEAEDWCVRLGVDLDRLDTVPDPG